MWQSILFSNNDNIFFAVWTQSGESNYRGLVKISANATNSESFVKCDTIILDDLSKSDTFPKNIVLNDTSTIEHEDNWYN